MQSVIFRKVAAIVVPAVMIAAGIAGTVNTVKGNAETVIQADTEQDDGEDWEDMISTYALPKQKPVEEKRLRVTVASYQAHTKERQARQKQTEKAEETLVAAAEPMEETSEPETAAASTEESTEDEDPDEDAPAEEAEPVEESSEAAPVAEASATEAEQPQTSLPEDVVSYVEYGGYIGRFSVPSVGIDVAMYNEYTQSATDRRDSAATLHLPQSNESVIIADHSTQSFSVLPDVSIGDTAMVTLSDGNVIYYQCVDIRTGWNADGIEPPYDLVDGNGHSVYGDSDLLTYTCYPHHPNIILILWNKI